MFLCLSTEPPCNSVLGRNFGSLELALFQAVCHLSNSVASEGEASLDSVSSQFPVIKLFWKEFVLLSLLLPSACTHVFLITHSLSFLCTA